MLIQWASAREMKERENELISAGCRSIRFVVVVAAVVGVFASVFEW